MHARMLQTTLPRTVVPSLHAMRERWSYAALPQGLKHAPTLLRLQERLTGMHRSK